MYEDDLRQTQLDTTAEVSPFEILEDLRRMLLGRHGIDIDTTAEDEEWLREMHITL